MAEPTPTQEELALRRRARRRLVGAIALALLAIVVLPMIFDPEPRPMANNVEIQIPGQTTPFQPDMPAPTEAPPAVSPEPASIAKPEAMASAPAKPEPKMEPAVKPSPEEKPKAVAKPVEKPKVAAKPAEKPKAIEKPKPVEKPAPKPAVATGYYLQLGSFSSEANAKQLAERAQAAGFKASVLPVSGQYKVRVGPFQDRTAAVDYEGKLKAKGLNAVVVEP